MEPPEALTKRGLTRSSRQVQTLFLNYFVIVFVQIAAKLCTEAGSEAPAVEAKREEIGAKYAALQQDIQVTLFCKKKTHHIKF